MKRLIILTILGVGFSSVWAQDDWMSYPATNQTQDSSRVDAATKLDFTKNNGKVQLHEDGRLSKISEFLLLDQETIEGVKMDGFRVMIFFDQKKTVAEQQKATFISLYPDHQTYVDYVAPNYRVRVGNFRTKLEAEELKSQVLMLFPTAIVIEDKIQLPSLEELTTDN